MSKSISSLEEDILSLIECLSENLTIPKYKSIKIILDEDIDYIGGEVPKIKETSMLSINDYSEVYESLKHEGMSWINLQAAGVYNKILICIVEHPKHTTGSIKTSINFSGPFRSKVTGEFDWNISEHFQIAK